VLNFRRFLIMKNEKLHRNLKFLIGLAVAGALVLAACPAPTDPWQQDVGYGRVSVSTSMYSERTILPDAGSLVDVTSNNLYEFYIDSIASNNRLPDPVKDGDFFLVPFGKYQLKITVRGPGNETIASGS